MKTFWNKLKRLTPERLIPTVLAILLVLLAGILPTSKVLASDTLYEYYSTVETFTPLYTFYAEWCQSVVGQTFTPQTSHNITSIKLKLYRTGNPGTIQLWLYATSGGIPTGYAIAHKDYDGDTITTSTSGEWTEFVFTGSYQLNADTKYVLLLRAPYTNSSNNIYVGYDGTSPTYTRGNYIQSYDDGESWNQYTTKDLGFYEYGTPLISKPTVTTQDATDVGSTTATGNGNITDTGGENATKRGICYNTTGNPTVADSKVEEIGSFSTGAFDEALTGLDVGETYYARAYAYNSAGYGYGEQISFTTSLTTPAIVVNDASNVAKTSARLNSTLTDDGGEACEIRFGYGTTSEDAVDFDDYDTVTDWVDGYTTGQHPYYDATSLDADETYYYRVQAKNSEGTITSTDEIDFTTEAAVSPASNFNGVPEATSISLSWVKGAGATQSLIRYSFDTYPDATDAGTQLYLGTGSSTTHTELTPGTTVYYTIWCESGGAYSTAVNLMLTTSAGITTGIDVDAPEMPSNWFLETDYTNMSNFEPFYGTINSIADSISMPRSTTWLIASLVVSMIAAFGVFTFSNHNMLAAGITMTIGMSIASAQHLIPLWILFLTLAVLVGVGLSRRMA